MNSAVELIAESNQRPIRLDKFISQQVKDISRTRVQHLIKTKCVHVNGALVDDSSYGVQDGDVITFDMPVVSVLTLQPKEMSLTVVFEDDHLAVINKPAGLSVHPGAGNNTHTLVNALMARYKDELSSVGGLDRPGIVHRLDKNTSGLLIIAKTNEVHIKLSELLQGRQIKRVYHSVVWGCLSNIHGTVDAPIGRSWRNRTKMSVVALGGRPAVTHYRTLKVFPNKVASLLECTLETGRTHQIRVHLSHLGHSIIGDPEYANKYVKSRKWLSSEAYDFIKCLHRQMLHAKLLSFIHPITGELVKLEADIPEDMNELIKILSK